MAASKVTREQGSGSTVATLKRRADFQRVRSGARWATPGFVLEGSQRSASLAASQPRFGFTVSKGIGKAVERNRVRRRLRAAVGAVQKRHAKANFDYVLIARQAALDRPFADLVADLVTALDGVHRKSLATPSRGKRRENGTRP
jgi:ribonuclease P protein component